MKVLIFEAFTDANIGSAALIENAVKIIKKKFPQSAITIQAQAPNAVSKFIGLPAQDEIFIFPSKQAKIKQFAWLLTNALWMAAHFLARLLQPLVPESIYTFNRRRLESLVTIKQSDICISIGAERINDNFFKGVPFTLYMLWIVKNYRKKLIMLPQTIGPFHFRFSKLCAAYILKKCDRIYVRDRRSEAVLKEMKLDPGRYEYVPDIALLQEACPAQEISRIQETERIPQGRSLAGISALKWGYFKAPEQASNYNEYKKIVAAAADYLIERYNYHVVFIPTNLKMHGCKADDVETQCEIFQMMRNKSNATLVRNLYTPAEIKGILSTMDMLIATRMHACILATSAHVPTVSINYQFKLYEYMKLLGLEQNTIDIEKLNFDAVKILIDRTYEARSPMREQLIEKINHLKNIIEERLVL